MNRNLLIRAYEIIDGIPAKRFNLNATAINASGPVDASDCGTIGCALGWLGLHPEFQALGLRTDPAGRLSYRGHGSWYATVGREFFGITYGEAERLFGPAGYTPGTTHKKMFLKRVREFLNAHP